MSKATVSFEKAFQRLEEIARLLEGNDLPLDEALKLFEEGMGLAKDCGSRLDQAEGRIQKLVEKADGSTDTEEMDL